MKSSTMSFIENQNWGGEKGDIFFSVKYLESNYENQL